MICLKYDYDEKVIYYSLENGKTTVVARDFPSEPQFSPDNKFAAYISPLEWEELGSLYLFDLESGEVKLLVGPDENNYIPKDVVWVNSRAVAVIIGFGHGTISVGGNVFLVPIDQGPMKQITFYEPEIQLTKLIIDGDTLRANGISYIDNDLNIFVEFSAEIGKLDDWTL